jgi:hypothetical protein
VAYIGHDYGELLGVVVSDYELGIIDEDEAIDELRITLTRHFDLGEAEFDEEGQIIVLEMRDFLNALIHCADTVTAELPVWKALVEVRDNHTFVQMFLRLITMMWN